MIITYFVLILFHQLMTRVAYVGSQSTPACPEYSAKVQDKGSPYKSTNMFFMDSTCQTIYQKELGDTLLKGCAEKSKREEIISKQNNLITTKVLTLERKINDIAEKTALLRLRVGNATCRTGYEYYEADKFCYKLFSDCKTWTEARQACQQDGADLIVFNERNFNFFKQLARSKAGTCNSFWVGTTDTHMEGQWNWLNGVRITSMFWNPNQPDNYANSEHCGNLAKLFGYMLNDENCSQRLHYICQIS